MKYKIFKIEKREILVFIFTFIIGIFAHSFMIFNKISFLDDLSSIYGFSAIHLFSLGRFSLGILKIINDFLFNSCSSPVINGFISMLLITLSNIIIAKLFDIKKTLVLLLLSSIIVLSTAYICLQAYLFTAIYYTFAIFLSCLSTYIFIKITFKNIIYKVLIVAFLQMIVTSIYQSYFLFGIMIFLIYQIFELIKNNFNLKSTESYFISIILSLVLYKFANYLILFLINIACKSITNLDSSLSISNYQGISKFGINNILSFKSIINVLNKLFTSDSIMFENNFYIYILLLLFVIISYFIISFNNHLSFKSILLISIYTIMLLFTSNALYLLEGLGTSLYALPMFPKCILFLLPIVLLDNINLKLNIFAYIVLFYYLSYNTAFANSIYINRYFTLENEKRWCQTFVTRIQSVPNYSDEYDIYIYGEQIGNNILKNDNHYANNTRFLKSIIPFNIDSINQYNFESFLEYYSGFKAWSFHKNDKSFDTSFIISMPCYPDDGSIQVIDDKIIIKFSDFNEK